MLLVCGRSFFLILAAAFIAGCAQKGEGFGQSSGAPYSQTNLDQLLSFGADMANAPPATQAKLCKSLIVRQQLSQDAGIQLHLMVGRLLSDSCGSIPQVLEGVNAIPEQALTDVRLRQLIAIHTKALKQMDATPISRERRRHKSPSKAQTPKRTNQINQINQDETRLLREKLQAIRAMEKKLDENIGGN